MHPKTVREMIGFFRSMYGISEENLEVYAGTHVDNWGAEEIDTLRELLLHLKIGAVDANDFALNFLYTKVKGQA